MFESTSAELPLLSLKSSLMTSRTRQTRFPGLESEESSSAGEMATGVVGKGEVSEQSLPGLPSGPAPATPADCGPTAATTLQVMTKPPKTLRGKSVYVVDSHSLIFQVFHALPEMTSPLGEPVGAVFGFTRDLM